MNTHFKYDWKRFAWSSCAGLAFSALLTGCVSRTSPETVPLASIQAKLTAPGLAGPLQPAAAPAAVGIRYPAAFQSTDAKLLMMEKLNQMMTKTDKKGRPRPDPLVSWQSFPEETLYKSLAASLQVRDVLLSNHNVAVFLIPCIVGETNGELSLQPMRSAVNTPVVADINLLNLLINMPNVPWYKFQGCSMSRYLSPMVAVSVASESGTNVVAGTRRWLTKDHRLAVVLPEVLERRYTSFTRGVHMNFPIVTTKHNHFPPVNVARPANATSYYELDSFLERDKTTKDFQAYWSFVADVIADVAKAVPAYSASMVREYARHLGTAELPEAKVALARKFMEAEWKFMLVTDTAMVQALRDSEWLEAIDQLGKSEDKLLAKAKSKHFWNQFAQVGMALAGGAAAGAGAAAAVQSGTTYNSAPVTMMTSSAIQALGEAGSQEQLAAVSSYKSVVSKTETSVNSVSLGLGDEAAGATIKSIDDIRRIAQRHLSVVTAAAGESRE